MRDLVGQRFNGYELNRSLRAMGHDAEMLVVYKESSDASVRSTPKAVRLLERGLYAAERVTSLQGLLSPIALSFPLRKCFRRADVVHWHLVYPHYVSLPLMPMMARLRPTVWTLHDPWALTGHCVHPQECERWRTGCGQCPDLSRDFKVWFDTTALVWRAKHALYPRAPITLVVASPWMKDRVDASPLLSGMPCHVIPFGLDLGIWRLLDRDACRARLGVPPGAKVLAFRVPLGWQKQQDTKGIPWLLEALRRLETKEPICLLVLDDVGRLAELRSKYHLIELGWVHEEARMVEVLSAADLFLFPSVAESFGLMALEAMACRTPVIGCEGTAVADTVRAPRAGVLVPPRNSEALAHAIAELLADDERRASMGRMGREIVESEYTHEAYVSRHVALYEEVAARRRLQPQRGAA